ncbi:Gamma_adaptin [Hexamita inflata]|uniref:AP-2 complex subunit alpha n=1 Tax=Hexamita inflata TaxID=28002 RepID=A0AA86UFV8_9EUKA|nr:Gamma adaptin [Hexamita inflata]CAI9950246.1 Gamma adaptin [Hexamita inflata]
MSITAEELIRRVRAAKTPAQEAAIIETELSAIRSSFKLRDQPYIARNVAKLIYASMRGHSVVWGDMGIVNLCQSAKTHKEKRLSYLALQLVPHDNPTYLKMASNSIKTDMESGSQYRASVALQSLAAVGTPEMLSELSSSTLALIKNKDSVYIRKKALIVALKTAKVAPEVAEVFVEPSMASILDKSQSISLSGCQLAQQLISSVDGSAEKYCQNIQQYLKLLQEIATQSGSGVQEHEIGGVNDPFLQVALLRLISSIIAKIPVLEDQFIKRQMADILENLVTMIHKKGESVPARVCVQFEAARVIMCLPVQMYSDNPKKLQDLRAAAADALTESLDHKNQSVRYSALASITDIIHKTNETQGAQRHRSTVLQCMQEESITLRRRALNLLVLITDQDSAKTVAQQLLDLIGKIEKGKYLAIKGALNEDIKKELISSVAFIAESFSTDPEWHFDILFACLQLIGAGKPNDDLIRQITAHLAREKSIQAYAMEKLVSIFIQAQQTQQYFYNETLMAACMYCIGECANLIQEPTAIVNTIFQIVEGPLQSQVLIRYAVSTVAKMYTKCPAAKEMSQQILQKLLQNADPEIQQRAYEYSIAITEPKASGLLGAIPPPPRIQTQIVQNEYQKPKPQEVVQQQYTQQQQVVPQVMQQVIPQAGQYQPPVPVQQMQGPPKPGYAQIVPGQGMQVQQQFKQPVVQNVQPVQKQQQQTTMDDLLGMGTSSQQAPKQMQLLDDLMGPSTAQPQGQVYQQQVQQTQQQQSMITATKKLFVDGNISFVMKSIGTTTQAECQFMMTGIGQTDIKVRAQYAAAQGVNVKVGTASGDIIGPNKPPVTQSIMISGGVLALKIKLQYILPSGQPKENMITVQNVYQ